MGYSHAMGDPVGVDLTQQPEVETLIVHLRPHCVLVAAGMAGGIGFNTRYPADLMTHNLQILTNILPTAHRYGVKRLLYFASSCIYPRECPMPAREEMLLTGPMEPTSEPYSLAKLAGLKLCNAYRKQYGADFFGVIPTNLYGPDDTFEPGRAHVVGALFNRIGWAKQMNASEVEIWGTGNARRELLHVDDAAEAAVLLMERYKGEGPVNIGGGEVVSIGDLAQQICEVVGFKGKLRFEASQPEGAPFKALDGHILREMGWCPRRFLPQGLQEVWNAFSALLFGAERKAA